MIYLNIFKYIRTKLSNIQGGGGGGKKKKKKIKKNK